MGRPFWGALLILFLSSILLPSAVVLGMGSVHGYRLKVPPCGAWYCRILPFQWWEQVDVYDKFTECERGREAVLATARDAQAFEDELNRKLKQERLAVPDKEAKSPRLVSIKRVDVDPRFYAACEEAR